MSALPTGIVNFRDFSGYPSRYGGRVRRGLLYRSGHLVEIEAADVERLLRLDFALIVDLRSAEERRRFQSPWPERHAHRVLSYDSDYEGEAPHLQLLRDNRLTIPAVEGFFTNFYSTLPYRPPYRELFSRALRALGGTDGRVLVHCTAGKDRTGVLVALIHHALGVDWNDIVTDYERSHTDPGVLRQAPEIVARTLAKYGHSPDADAVRTLLGAKEAYIVRLKESRKRAAGKWTDAATGEHGDLLDVIRESCQLIDFKDVVDVARAFLSLRHLAPQPDPGRSWKPGRRVAGRCTAARCHVATGGSVHS